MKESGLYLLQARDRERAENRERERLRCLGELKRSLHQTIPGVPVFVFGSVLRPGRFRPDSDIDLALERIPEGVGPYGLTALLEEKLGRPVDVVELGRCRFDQKIREEGERWIA